VIAGYASRCDGSVIRAVEHGVNVVIWSFFHVATRQADFPVSTVRRRVEQSATIETPLDLACVRREINYLNQVYGDTVVHLASFGGWNAKHLDGGYSSKEIYEAWNDLDVFDGIDWDLEGNDDLKSPYNHFSLDCLDKMGEISELAHNDGFIVGMAPPQSYLDPSSTHFSRYLNHTHPGRKWHGDFSYAGRNVYAYLLAVYGHAIDMVSVQLYESYSRAANAIYELGMPASDYLESYVEDLALRHEKFLVEFSQDPEVGMEDTSVRLPLSKLVIGLANSWAEDGDKTLYVDPSDIGRAYSRLNARGRTIRGFMFWTIDEEGTNGVYMADELNRSLNGTQPFAVVSWPGQKRK
jgi:beta-glucosidase